jgi:isopenicillin-N N-acyltransferase-like protein
MANVPASKEYAADLVDEVDGIAQGANLPFEKVFLLNCFDEVGCHGPGRYAAAHHCTAFAATGRATRDGTTYVGQGWDTGPASTDWYRPIILRLVRSTGEPEALVFTHPGIVGGTGINTSGLALVWNTTSPTDARVGVPATFVVRKALQQPSLAPLVGAVINCQRAGGLNFIVGTSDGAVDIEVTATRYAVTYSATVLHHANHYEAPELRPFEKDIPLRTPDTLIRTGRMRHVLEERFGAIDVEGCKDILRDHGGWPGSICRHHAPEHNVTGQSEPSLLYVPAEGRMFASNGPPCQFPFEEYALTPTAALALT